MIRKRRQLQAYFAGVFDGEGSVTIVPNGRAGAYTVKVQVKMCDPRAIGLMAREYPEFKLTGRQPNWPGSQLQYELIGNGYTTARFLKEMQPYCIIKREQIKLALTFLTLQSKWFYTERKNGAGGVMVPLAERGDYVKRAENLSRKIRHLNKVAAQGVNSVNSLLGYGLREYRAKREDVEQDVEFLRAELARIHEGVETRHSVSDDALRPVAPLNER